ASLVIYLRSCLPRRLPSFPTRRSSDLAGDAAQPRVPGGPVRQLRRADRHGGAARLSSPVPGRTRVFRELHRLCGECAGPLFHARSEEHTSELQSRENLVCRLLLEKKKT